MGRNQTDILEEPKDAAALLGYLRIVEIGPDLFCGAILPPDLRGKSRDFRCTSAIKPNAIQRILYVGTLSEHMALDLSGLPLLKAFPVQPPVLLADRPATRPWCSASSASPSSGARNGWPMN